MNKRLLYSLWTLASLLLFLWILFPGEFAERFIEAHADRTLRNGSVNVEGVGLTLPPGLSVKGLVLTLPELSPVTARNIRVIPSWLTLMTSRPGAGMRASVFGGKASADVRIGYGGKGWNSLTGQVADMDLATLSPFIEGRLPVDLALGGQGEAALELSRDKGVSGVVRMQLADVTVGFDDPIIPVKELAFGTVTAEGEVKGRTLTLSRVHVEGREVSAELRGTLTLSNRFESSRINISGTLNPDPEFVRELTDRVPLAMLADPKLLKGGRIPLRISGTLGNPSVSFK